MRVPTLALVAAFALVLEREGALSAAEPKPNDAGTCRSVGGLKFDPSQRSMQRVRRRQWSCSRMTTETNATGTIMTEPRDGSVQPVQAQHVLQ
jgi:hypothetical protein